MMSNTEPNSLPSLFADRSEWREAYAAYAEEFKKSPKTFSDEVLLKLRLVRLGFTGTILEAEITYVKENP